MSIKSNLLVQATKYNNKRVVEFTLSLFDVLDKFFSFSRKRKSSYRKENNQHLNDSLVFAIENLNFDIVELLVNKGADVNLLDKNNKNAITHAVERLASLKGLSVDPSKNLPEEIISHHIVQFLLVNGSEYYNTDSMNIEERHASLIRRVKVPHSLQSEHICEEIPSKKVESQLVYNERNTYEKVDGFGNDDLLSSCYSSIKKEEFITKRKLIHLLHVYTTVGLAAKQVVFKQDNKHIYEKIDPFIRKDSNLYSNYSNIEKCAKQKEHIYEEISDYRGRESLLYFRAEECKIHKKWVDLSKQESIYSRVDFDAKRLERKAKSIRANSSIYHGLVKDRKNQWEEKINKCKSEANTTINREEVLCANNTRKTFGINVERIRKKYESDYYSGYSSDIKLERSRNFKTPNSKVNSVYVEYGIVGCCRYKITDVSF